MTDDPAYGVYGNGTVAPGDRPAILVVDYQKAFTTDGLGMGGTALIERGLAGAARVLAAARVTGVPVFQFHVSFGEAEGGLGLWANKVPQLAEIRAGTPWVEIDERVSDPSDSVIAKKWPSAFAGTPLAALLTAQKVDTVIVTGCTTSGCVRATVVDAFSHNLRVIVPVECVADRGELSHKVNLFDMHMKYADVLPVEDVAEYLRVVAGDRTAAAT